MGGREEMADVVLWADAVYSDLGGFLLGRAILAHLHVNGLCAAVVPEQQRVGMDMLETELRLGGFVRAADKLVPADLVEHAIKRFGLALDHNELDGRRLVIWKAEDLYN